jgi:hypothetical protein
MSVSYVVLQERAPVRSKQRNALFSSDPCTIVVKPCPLGNVTEPRIYLHLSSFPMLPHEGSKSVSLVFIFHIFITAMPCKDSLLERLHFVPLEIPRGLCRKTAFGKSWYTPAIYENCSLLVLGQESLKNLLRQNIFYYPTGQLSLKKNHRLVFGIKSHNFQD